jgi:Coenzyme PQQ synthesis protein D (PqqD)
MTALCEESKPLREFDVRSRTYANEHLLLRVHVTMRTNAIGLEIWRQCSGEATIAEIAAQIATDYGAPEAEVRQDCMDFVRSLVDAQFVRLVSDD